MDPLLKWPGGKRWLAPIIAPSIEGRYSRFVEPFLGAGALLFQLEPAKGFAADINAELVAAYHAVQEQPAEIIFSLSELGCAKSDYYRIRDGCMPETSYGRAARLIYLLQHSWNGLYRVNRVGHFNVPYSPRIRKHPLTIEKLTQFSRVLSGITIECQDFEKTLEESRPGDLIFADPPYFSKDAKGFSRYNAVAFPQAEQERLASALKQAERRGAAWILTNGSVESVNGFFKGYETFELSRRSALAADPARRRRISEYIVLSSSDALSSLREFLRDQLACQVGTG